MLPFPPSLHPCVTHPRSPSSSNLHCLSCVKLLTFSLWFSVKAEFEINLTSSDLCLTLIFLAPFIRLHICSSSAWLSSLFSCAVFHYFSFTLLLSPLCCLTHVSPSPPVSSPPPHTLHPPKEPAFSLLLLMNPLFSLPLPPLLNTHVCLSSSIFVRTSTDFSIHPLIFCTA